MVAHVGVHDGGVCNETDFNPNETRVHDAMCVGSEHAFVLPAPPPCARARARDVVCGGSRVVGPMRVRV